MVFCAITPPILFIAITVGESWGLHVIPPRWRGTAPALHAAAYAYIRYFASQPADKHVVVVVVVVAVVIVVIFVTVAVISRRRRRRRRRRVSSPSRLSCCRSRFVVVRRRWRCIARQCGRNVNGAGKQAM